MKFNALISTVAMLAGALTACDRDPMPQSPGSTSERVEQKAEQVAQGTERVVEDSTITAKVKLALLNDTDVKSADISVETSQGRVTLSGTVPSEPQVHRAVKAANKVEGVQAVENRLMVKPGA
jgi:hyperosmotically inducible protein